MTTVNVSSAAVDPRYRRVMDWDVEPTPFSEFSTIQGTAGASAVSFSSNDGFASAKPLSGPSDRGFTGDFVDAGPRDHGAPFDFDFASLAPGASQSFTSFYGAAATETAAINALAAVGAEVYAYGQPSTQRRTARLWARRTASSLPSTASAGRRCSRRSATTGWTTTATGSSTGPTPTASGQPCRP